MKISVRMRIKNYYIISRIVINHIYILPENLDLSIMNNHKYVKKWIHLWCKYQFRFSWQSDNRQQRRGSHEVASINVGCLNWFSCLNSYVFSNWVRLRFASREAQYCIAQHIGWKYLCTMLLWQINISYS